MLVDVWPPASALRRRLGIPLSLALFAALTLYTFFPLLRCLHACLVDHVALQGTGPGRLELADARLNTWILAWVQHALLSDPAALFDANIFYPARGALTQSEHLLGIAVLALPLRVFTSNAVSIHQLALALSTLLLALGTFALVRWLTGSSFASCAAGVVAAFMPWRLAELPHVQLMHVQWLPLAWLYLGRIACGDTRRRNALALTGFATLQVLSSFYAAYFLVGSCAVLLAVLGVHAPLRRPALRACSLACVTPAAALLWVAIPYLRWQAGFGFQALSISPQSIALRDAASLLLPGLAAEASIAARYGIPLVVWVAAACAFLPRAAGDAARRARSFAWAMLALCVACFVLLLGRELELGDFRVGLPARWAALAIPGFDLLRNPLRWAIPIGLALPVLVGIGLAQLERRAGSARRLGALRGLAVLALAVGLPLGQLPAGDAWDGKGARRRAYRALAALPPGPVVEMPWPLQPLHDTETASLYMLGSTLHWRPLANGTSGYVPAPYPLLRQLAQDLPDASALRRFQQLADVRWIVVHREDLSAPQRVAWAAALRTSALRRVYTDPTTWILEVADWQRGGRFTHALTDPTPRPTTLAGLPRAPLEPTRVAGSLAVESAGPFRLAGDLRIPERVSLRVSNDGDAPWPGLDVQTEGLVRLRYAFLDADGNVVLTDTAALAADLPARASRTLRVPITPPDRAGAYRLRLDLVQRLGDLDHRLPIDAVELPVEVQRSPGLSMGSRPVRARSSPLGRRSEPPR
jgi:hypothetical protein